MTKPRLGKVRALFMFFSRLRAELKTGCIGHFDTPSFFLSPLLSKCRSLILIILIGFINYGRGRKREITFGAGAVLINQKNLEGVRKKFHIFGKIS